MAQSILSHVAPPTEFHAQWDTANQSLQSTAIEKIGKVFFFFINKVISALVLPSAWSSKAVNEEWQKDFDFKWERSRTLNSAFERRPLLLTAPDGVKIHGTYFKHRNATETAPTTIFFQPNGVLSNRGIYNDMLILAAVQEIPCHFLYIDYRGCGSSTSAPTSSKELILDGETAYQFVRDHLKVSPENIHFYGWSLGGGVSALVKSLHPECTGNYVNDRSFSSLSTVAQDLVSRIVSMVLPISQTSRLTRSLSFLAAKTLSFLNWEIDAGAALSRIKGRTLIVHHPDDTLITPASSLAARVNDSAIRTMNLKDYSEWAVYSCHCADLAEFDPDNFQPERQIAQFLLGSTLSFEQRMLQVFEGSSQNFKNRVFAQVAVEYQSGYDYWRSGEDAFYSRNGQSLSERDKVAAILSARRSGSLV